MGGVNARIVLWGIEGSGKTTTLETIHAKLREDLRGDLRREPTRLDPTIRYEALPISLGEVGGVGTQIELIAVPGAPEQAMTRKQLLDEVDGIVLVLDCSPERIRDNGPAIDELERSLAAYGQRLDALPLVLQYNKRDVADPFAIEDLHRQIGLEQAAVFETIATTGHGILPTLTTISKHVVRARRGASGEIDPRVAAEAAEGATTLQAAAAPPESLPDTPEIGLEATSDLEGAPESEATSAVEDLLELETAPELEPFEPVLEAFALEEDSNAMSTAELLESAILAEGEEEGFQTLGAIEVDLDDETPEWAGEETPAKPSEGALRVISVGQATVEADGGVRLPLVLGDEEGASRSAVLTLRLDALPNGDSGD